MKKAIVEHSPLTGAQKDSITCLPKTDPDDPEQKKIEDEFKNAFGPAGTLLSREDDLKKAVSKKVRARLKREIQRHGDKLTRVKTAYAINQHRPLITAALKHIRQHGRPTDFHKFFEKMEKMGATKYKQANGEVAKLGEKQVQNIMKKVFDI